ncbi:MAG: S-layer family protein [Nostoc sp. DedQUE04]|uniref:beta strand repeat-containing protein n=1 Tax=Nostoc sp. DedQUE04 TaxID=3075390 RepID=UPI002AD3FBE6|nr:S-layer family protein [Nostoc sp. DedQUE04]MDZ8134181.1 S-layer family protein [Nostoc sp. DedQUE04]
MRAAFIPEECKNAIVNTKNITIAENTPENSRATIYKSTLEGLSGNTNIIFQATNDITINTLSGNSLNLANGSGKVTFNADVDGDGIGNFQMPTADTIKTNGRNISISGASLTLGNINIGDGDLEGGNITLTATQGDISTQLLNSSSNSYIYIGVRGNGGDITLIAQGNISTQSLNSDSFSSYDDRAAGKGGDITLTAQGNIFTRSLDSFSSLNYGTAGNGGDITLTAQGDIKGIRYIFNEYYPYNNEYELPVFSSFSLSKNGVSGQGGNVTLTAKNQITDLEILTLSSNSKSGDVQIKGFGDLSLTNTDIITSKQVTIRNRYINPQDIILDVGGVGQSGNVTVTSTGNLTFNNSRIESDTRGSDPAGNITITSPGTVTLNNNDISKKITSNTSSEGKAGNIQINANNLVLTDASEISASTIADGKAGDITLNTPTLTVANDGKISATTEGSGDGGTITINAPNQVNLGIGVQDFTPILSVETSGAGKAGDIIVNTPSLTVSDTARITATATKTATNTQGGGSITLNASKINLAGTVGVLAETQGETPAGTLKLNPYQNQPDLDITLFPNSIISASTSASGKGGDLILAAPETINIAGQGKLTVESTGTGEAGNIQITTQNLNINDGVKISASNNNIGKGGNIQVNANNLRANNGAQFSTATSGNAQAGNINLEICDQIALDGTDTGLFANTEKGSIGNGGNINLITNDFFLTNGGRVSTSSEGEGKAGDIKIDSSSIKLDNQGFIAAASNSGDGGNINLTVNDILLLRGGSGISTTAGTAQLGGNGGNINIYSKYIIAIPEGNSDITANAFTGTGGNVEIKSQGIFGIEARPKPTEKSDITASSEQGIAGAININALDTSSIQNSFTELPPVIDTNALIANSCISRGTSGKKTLLLLQGLVL